jgi:hypothetical protein
MIEEVWFHHLPIKLINGTVCNVVFLVSGVCAIICGSALHHVGGKSSIHTYMAFVLCTPFNEKMSSSDICTS